MDITDAHRRALLALCIAVAALGVACFVISGDVMRLQRITAPRLVWRQKKGLSEESPDEIAQEETSPELWGY